MTYLYIAVAVLSWGLWGIFNKLALHSMHPVSVSFVSCMVETVAAVIYFAIMQRNGYSTTAVGIFWATAAGVSAIIATLACMCAAANAEISYVISATAVYPAVTFLIAVTCLGETFNLQRLIGLILIVVGTFVVGQ